MLKEANTTLEDASKLLTSSLKCNHKGGESLYFLRCQQYKRGRKTQFCVDLPRDSEQQKEHRYQATYYMHLAGVGQLSCTLTKHQMYNFGLNNVQNFALKIHLSTV